MAEPAARPAGRLRRLLAAIREVMSRAQPWPDALARAGFVAKGVVYVVVGGLALKAAAGLGGQATDPTGVLADAARSVLGRTALGVVALGLVAHGLFRALLALVGEPYGSTTPLRRIARRVANAAGAIAYLGLSVTAAALSIGWKAFAHADSDTTTQRWSGRLLHAPLGRPLLLGVALGIAIAAVVAFVRVVFPGRSRRRLRVEDMSPRERTTVAVVGRLAFLARAIILATVAYYLTRAAIDRAPREARGPAGALHAAWEYRHGSWLLALMAAGLLSVGAFAFLEARWRRLFSR
jgi:Domain of Unknown Function (DUF1206)